MSLSLDEMASHYANSIKPSSKSSQGCDPCKAAVEAAAFAPSRLSDACCLLNHTFEDCDDNDCACMCHYDVPNPRHHAGSVSVHGTMKHGNLIGTKIIVYDDDNKPEWKLWLPDGSLVDLAEIEGGE